MGGRGTGATAPVVIFKMFRSGLLRNSLPLSVCPGMVSPGCADLRLHVRLDHHEAVVHEGRDEPEEPHLPEDSRFTMSLRNQSNRSAQIGEWRFFGQRDVPDCRLQQRGDLLQTDRPVPVPVVRRLCWPVRQPVSERWR